MITNLWAIFADVKIDRLSSLLSCSEMKCTIVLRMNALIAPLIAQTLCKNHENWFSSFWVKVGEKMKIVLRLGRNWTIFVHLAYWHSEGIGISQFSFQQFNRQSFRYIAWNFGEIRISHRKVLCEKNYTVGVDNFYHTYFTYVCYGMGQLGTQVISKCFYK